MTALAIGLVGCNEELGFIPTSDSGTTDTGGGDTGGTTTTDGTSDSGLPIDLGLPSDGGGPADTGPGDAETVDADPTGDTGDSEIPPADRASFEAYCEALTACGVSEEECLESIDDYIDEFVEEYGLECLSAYASYFDCLVRVGECDEDELYSDECNDEYDATTNCLEG
jgi:hypothetical protein